MNLKLFKINDIGPSEKEKIDEFILEENTNGEFINTIKYLSYHPKSRFVDDSIYIKDLDSGTIKCILMSASTTSQPQIIISHPGTTFSGIVLNYKTNIQEINEIINLIESYYKNKYEFISLKVSPFIYHKQPNQLLEYLLMKNEYIYSFTALANVIDLSKAKNTEDIFNLYDSKRRNHVRKTIKNNQYEFLQLKKIEEPIWENINKNLNVKYNVTTTHSYSEIVNLNNKFPRKIVPYASYRKDGQYGAFSLIYKFKNVFHTQYLDLNYKLRNENPNLYLIHNLIKTAINEGYKYFSFGASTEKEGRILNEGLFNFKNQFGGGSILLPKYTKKLN